MIDCCYVNFKGDEAKKQGEGQEQKVQIRQNEQGRRRQEKEEEDKGEVKKRIDETDGSIVNMDEGG